MNQAAIAQALAGLELGPKIHEVTGTATGIWTVADRVEPGDQLASLPNNRGTFLALLRIFRGLSDQSAPRPDLPRLTDWLRQRLQDDHLADLPPNRQPATSAERKRGLAILDDLARDTGDGLCHGDMSSANILLDKSGRLLLIDPRGLAGDATYDAAVLTAKAHGYGLSAEYIERQAKHAGFDYARMRAWRVVVLAARV